VEAPDPQARCGWWPLAPALRSLPNRLWSHQRVQPLCRYRRTDTATGLATNMVKDHGMELDVVQPSHPVANRRKAGHVAARSNQNRSRIRQMPTVPPVIRVTRGGATASEQLLPRSKILGR
jgi:hypothetical protein